jgi:transposase
MQKEESTMKNTILAADLAKNVFEVAVSHRPGVVDKRHRLSRRRFLPFFAEHRPATVLLEACGSAHHWARELRKLGHTPLLLPAHDTRRAEAGHEVRQLEQRVVEVERQLREVSRHNPLIMRLRTVPGIGLLTATALVAFVGDVQRFRSGRRFACYLGLTPREFSSGGRRRLGRISKRGDIYIRMLLIHGARAVLNAAKRIENPDRLRAWALNLEARSGHNRAAVALANKMARIAWAVWRSESGFQTRPAAA